MKRVKGRTKKTAMETPNRPVTLVTHLWHKCTDKPGRPTACHLQQALLLQL